jgi:hypothetical protein
MKVQFTDVFRVNLDGTVTPKRKVNVGCVVLIPGISYAPKNSFLGFDLSQNKEDNIEVEEFPDQNVVYLRNAIV